MRIDATIVECICLAWEFDLVKSWNKVLNQTLSRTSAIPPRRDGVEDQGAEEAFMGPRENCFVSFWKPSPCERLCFQR